MRIHRPLADFGSRGSATETGSQTRLASGYGFSIPASAALRGEAMMNQLGAHDMGVTIWAASPRETKPGETKPGETTCEAGLTVDDRQRVIEPPPPVF